MRWGSDWSMIACPPSPKSAWNQAGGASRLGSRMFVPLSWVPPITMPGFEGCRPTLWNWVIAMLVFIEVQLAPLSSERQMPPSLPLKTRLGDTLGSNTMAWSSTWRPPETPSPCETPLQVRPPSSVRHTEWRGQDELRHEAPSEALSSLNRCGFPPT